MNFYIKINIIKGGIYQKMKNTRIISAILASIIMAGTLLVSCSDNNNKSTESTTQANTQANDLSSNTADSDSQTISGETAMAPDLPAKDYDGTDFVILDRYDPTEGWGWGNRDIYAEELNGEGVNDAVFMRNLAVEEKFNVKIKEHAVDLSVILSTLRNVVQAGDTAYDLVAPNFQEAIKMAQGQLIYDLREMDYVNLDASYWDQSMIEDTSIDHRVFYAIGDISIMANDATWIMMFNKQAITDNNLEDPYQIVRDGKWTFDKFYEMASDFSRDLDGDGKFGEEDQYALVTSNDSLQGFFYAADIKVIEKDENDLPIISPLSEKVTSVVEKTVQIMKSENLVYNNSESGRTHLSGQAVFEEGRGLFYAEVMQCVIRLREMEIDFGVLPFPKYDENQESYTTYIHANAASCITIPLSAGDAEKSQIILEEMAYQSQKYLRPAYYDQALRSKHMRDEESSEMLDIILAGRMSDLGYITDVGTLYSGLMAQMAAGKTDVASTYAKREKLTSKQLEKLIEEIGEYGS